MWTLLHGFTLSFFQEHLLKAGFTGHLLILCLHNNKKSASELWESVTFVGPTDWTFSETSGESNAVKWILTALFIGVLLFSAGRTSLVERCTSCASLTSSPLSVSPSSWTTPGSGFAWDQQLLSPLVITVVLSGKINVFNLILEVSTKLWLILGKFFTLHFYYILTIHELSVQMIFPLSDRLMQEKYSSSSLAWLVGKQHFLIPFNVLDLVYGQTVSWVGVYYCPLLPLIGTVTLIATFYIKKVACRISVKNHLFHFLSLSVSLNI